MRFLVTLALFTTTALAASIPFHTAEAAKCAMIRGSGIGATEGIARWMANKAVTDSATKWAAGGAHKLDTVKITCSGFSCDGAAKACKK